MAGSEKLSPRQKMINLMYLVFVAMLAMQIDQEIIRSFNDTQESLGESRVLTQKKNELFATALAEKIKTSPESHGKYQDIYDQLKSKVEALVSETESDAKALSVGVMEGKEVNLNALSGSDPASKLFFKGADENSPSEKTTALKTKMADLNTFIKTTLLGTPEGATQFQAVAQRLEKFTTGNIRGKKWEIVKFYNQPVVAALANLEIISSEARNMQADALSAMLQEKVDANMKFDSFEGIVAGPKVIVAGDKDAKANIFLGSFDSGFSVDISGASVQNGRGTRALDASSLGKKTIQGTISFKNAKGETKTVPYNHEYNVIAGSEPVKLQSGAIVSADKMNVLYRGVDNPVSASMLSASKVTLAAPGAGISGGNGKWTIKPGTGTTVDLVVSGIMPDGKSNSTKFPFRIKNIPAPQGQVRGSNALSMPASSVKNQMVTATIPDFDFPVTFTVNSFKVKVPGKPTTVINGSSLSSLGASTDKLRAGDAVFIYDIQATAVGLSTPLKNISSVLINVQ
jgi:gliding motility-associated protein GldM